MFETVMTTISGTAVTVFTAVPFSAAAWAVLLTLAAFTWVFARASRDPNSPVQWEHLIVDSKTNRASPYKMGFLLGAVISTWVVVTMTDADNLSFDILLLYLTYLLGGAGFNGYLKSKTSAQSTQDDITP